MPAVIGLQASAGNAAVTRLVRSHAVLSRYDTGEHAQLGSDRKVVIKGVEMTESEIIAMGDFFESPDAMYSADPGELAKLVVLIRRDRDAYQGKPGASHVTTEEWQEATSVRKGKSYLDLAKANEAHFGPRASSAPGGADHKSEWEKLHAQALEKAQEASGGDGKVPEEAAAINAFAAHFLTDAFSAGHLLAKQDIMDKAKEYWDKQSTTGWIFKETAFTKGVAKRVLNDPAVKKKLAGKQLKMIAWDSVTEERFSEFLWQMEKDEASQSEFFNGFAKMVHDELNEAIKKGAGIEVENEKGDRWALSGDETLALSPETAAIARAAVEESYLSLMEAARTPVEPLDYVTLCKRVWDYTPKPTEIGEKQIAKALETVADPRRPEAVEKFAQIAIGNIDTLIDELTKKGYMRDEPVWEPTPMDFAL